MKLNKKQKELYNIYFGKIEAEELADNVYIHKLNIEGMEIDKEALRAAFDDSEDNMTCLYSKIDGDLDDKKLVWREFLILGE